MDYGVVANAQSAAKLAVDQFLGLQNVVACGLGHKISRGQQTDELSLIVSVSRKIPAAQLATKDLIPKAFAGLRTDVVETGRIRALAGEDPRMRMRPAQPGVSIGHRDITAGTFGLLVHRGDNVFILSNNHVLADSNAAKLGDPIYQPGSADGGTAADQIASLAEFESLDFGDSPAQCTIVQTLARALNLLARLAGSGHRLAPVLKTSGLNLMDAALGLPDQVSLVKPGILELGTPLGLADPSLGQEVQKMGRTTGLTRGFITQVSVTADVDYAGRTARFTDQVFASPMSSPGDSGSSVLNMARQVVGLVFAGSERITILTPMRRILERFGVELVTEDL
ncbi:MAG: S1 family peptidase [Anaerolineae bacterium]|jgi:hypothetical protein|nr:S1 family peptidase [Anaerolineae bacterium]